MAVTQQFNTTTSMGRLTLNVLLSSAQFERELAGELIRDKFAASRRKGGYPQPALKFIPYASSANTKIQRQMGCFIYDTLNYEDLKVRDLEAFIGEHEVALRVGRQEPILTRAPTPRPQREVRRGECRCYRARRTGRRR